MEKKRKLGRTLDEVADFWLSSSPSTDGPSHDVGEDTLRQTDSKGLEHNTISLFYPESSKSKGLILTNIVIELAKRGYSTCVLDYMAHDSPMRLIVNNLFESFCRTQENDNSSGSHRVLKLHGMPGIHFFTRPEGNLDNASIPKRDDEMHSQLLAHNLEGSLKFLCHPDNLETISAMEAVPPIVIIGGRPQRESLLISYAYVKAVLKKNPHTHILMIMDEVTDRGTATEAFNLLRQIVVKRLPSSPHAPEFLGWIIHDQALGVSRATHYPLVLSEQHSTSRDNMIRITLNLLKALENPG